MIEAGTALAFLGLAWIDLGPDILADPLADASRWLVWGIHALVFSVLMVLSIIDLDFGILPNQLTIGGIIVAPFLVAACPDILPQPLLHADVFGMATWSPRIEAIVNSVLGAAAAYVSLRMVAWAGARAFRQEAMGGGDIKMFAAMGGLLGFWFVLALVLASFAGSIIGLAVLAITGNRSIRFGPCLAFGMVLTLLWGPEIFGTVMGWLVP